MDTRPTGDSEQPSSFELGDVAIYYRFAFTVGIEIHPNDAARRALSAELALTAVDVWGAVSITPAMADALNTIGRLRETASVASGRWAIPRFILRHPVLSARVLAKRQTEETAEAEPLRSLDDSADEVRQLIADLAVLDGFASQVDQDVVRPHYLATEPWIRLALPPVSIRHRGDDSRHTLAVNLLLHRCGQAVMTFGLLFAAPDGDAGIDKVNAWANGSAHDLVTTTLDTRLLEYAARANPRRHWRSTRRTWRPTDRRVRSPRRTRLLGRHLQSVSRRVD